MRRVNPKAAKAGEDPQLLPDWRHHAFVTDIATTTTLAADAWDRAHAQAENVIKEPKHHGGLAHLPSGVFAANAAWPGLVALAHNLGRCAPCPRPPERTPAAPSPPRPQPSAGPTARASPSDPETMPQRPQPPLPAPETTTNPEPTLTAGQNQPT